MIPVLNTGMKVPFGNSNPLLRKCIPSVEPYFAVKSNPSDEIIDIMIKNGIGFDVASIKFSKRCEIESSATTRIHRL